MVALWLAVLVTLRLTLPAYTSRGGCVETDAPVDLDQARLYGQPRGGADTLLQAHDASGRAGQPDSFSVTLDDRPWNLWVVATDRFGAESCRSDVVQANGALGVHMAVPGLWMGLVRPTPATALAEFSFDLPQTGAVRIEAFDLTGRRVARLGEAVYARGAHLVRWNIDGLGSGVYMLRLEYGGMRLEQRAVIVR